MWTEPHRREALRRTYELAAELIGDPLANIDTDTARAWHSTRPIGDRIVRVTRIRRAT